MFSLVLRVPPSEALEPYSTGTYVNFLDQEGDTGLSRPDGRVNQNIKPS